MTVVYLAAHVRLHVRSARGATCQSVVVAAFCRARGEGLFGGLEDPAHLAPVEALQFSMRLTSEVRSVENVHYQYSSDGISDDAWSGGNTRVQGMMGLPGARAWREPNRNYFRSLFARFLSKAIISD